MDTQQMFQELDRLYAQGKLDEAEEKMMGWMKEGEDIVEVKNPEDVTLTSIADNKARFINCQPDRDRKSVV